MVHLRLLLAACLLLVLPTACSLSRTATRAVEAQSRSRGLVEHRVVDGSRVVRYWKGGEGPPLLLLHGFGGNGVLTWQRQLPALMAHHTVVVPDLLWFGDSHAIGPVEPSLVAQADTMAALIRHERLQGTAVMGISYGGFVTLLLNQRHPDLVGDVIIVDSPGPVFDLDDRNAMLERLGVDSAEDMFVPEDADDVRALIAIVRPGGPRIPRFLLEDIRKSQFSSNHDAHRALLADLVALDGVFAPDDWVLPERSLVIWGEEDPVFPLEVGQELAQTLGAPLFVIQGAAHGPNFQRPRLFNQAVLAFLAGQPLPATSDAASDVASDAASDAAPDEQATVHDQAQP